MFYYLTAFHLCFSLIIKIIYIISKSYFVPLELHIPFSLIIKNNFCETKITYFWSVLRRSTKLKIEKLKIPSSITRRE